MGEIRLREFGGAWEYVIDRDSGSKVGLRAENFIPVPRHMPNEILTI